MKKLFASLLFIFIVISFVGAVDNSVRVGTVERGEETIISITTRPSGRVSVRLQGAVFTLDAIKRNQLIRYLDQALLVEETVLGQDIQVKWRRNLGSIALANQSIWMRISVNLEGALDRVTFGGSVTMGSSPDSDRFGLTMDEVRQFKELLATAVSQAESLSAEIAVLNNVMGDFNPY